MGGWGVIHFDRCVGAHQAPIHVPSFHTLAVRYQLQVCRLILSIADVCTGNLLAPLAASVAAGALRSGYSRVQVPKMRRRRAALLSKLKVLILKPTPTKMICGKVVRYKHVPVM